MRELLNLELTSVIVTLLAYQIGLLLQKKTKSPLCNPILIGAALVALFLTATDLENQVYQQATVRLSWLLTPATVCLAIPMYEQLPILLKNKKAILAGVASGALGCMGCVLLMARFLGFDRALTVSLLPKSVTAAIGVPMCELLGGTPSLTTVSIAVTGISRKLADIRK